MLALPSEGKRLLDAFRPAFTAPTYQRFLLLLIGAIVAMGRRTVSRILWASRCLNDGHPSSYHRFFSAARWSAFPLARVLAAAVLELIPADQPVTLAADDTVAEHRGKKVFGKGCHRDAVRSGSSPGGYVALKWGHRWVALAALVRLPLCKRDWALPLLAALYVPDVGDASKKKQRAKAAADKAGHEAKGKGKGKPRREHKTPALLARQMLATLLHWFPRRRFVLLGDWGFAGHEIALFCHRHADRVTLVGRIRSDARLFSRPPAQRRRGPGRRRRKGQRLPSPRESVAAATAAGARRALARVHWYGGGVRDVELLGGCGGWYRARGQGRAALVPVRWVFVHDPLGGRDDYFYSTDLTLTPRQIVEQFAGRWAIEVTFEEVRAHLGFETTRQRCARSVRRAGACLLGLFSVVSLIYAELAKAGDPRVRVRGTPCYHKSDPTFADALAAVRLLMWDEVILPRADQAADVSKLPPGVRELLLDHLAAAA